MGSDYLSAVAIEHRTAVDFLEPEDREQSETLDFTDLAAGPRDALAVFLRLILPATTPLNRGYWQNASCRLAALAHCLHVDPIGGHSLTQLAEAIGCTRSLLSLRATAIRDLGGLDAAAGRSTAARQAYSDRARSVWARRGNKSKS